MSDRTKINYVDASWNPVAGCTPVSAGCAHCFAARYAKRKIGAFAVDERDEYVGVRSHPFSAVQCREDQLDVPLDWRKPRTILVPTLGDLFHPDVPQAFIGRVLDVIAQTPQHRYLLLTKRPNRMRERVSEWLDDLAVDAHGLPHLWPGVSLSDQPDADRWLPILLDTPAAHRWISVEPMLAPTDLGPWLAGLSFCVVGGETGPGARPCRAEWIESVIEQCRAAGVPVWVKQLGTVLNKERLRDYQTERHLRELLVQEHPW